MWPNVTIRESALNFEEFFKHLLAQEALLWTSLEGKRLNTSYWRNTDRTAVIPLMCAINGTWLFFHFFNFSQNI